MRLIDADALIICLQGHYGVIEQDCSISEKFADGAISGIDAAMFEVDAAPTIEPFRLQGRWIGTGSGQECSECGEIQYGYDTGRFYCPNCGAKMDGKRREEHGHDNDPT